jgi:hypothetical protein
MSNDRHTPDDITRKMASAAAREPMPKDNYQGDATLDERRPTDDRQRQTRDEREVRAERERQTQNERPMPMFAGAEAAGYRTQWDAIQTGFVDEPRRAVQEADALVALVMKRLSEVFTDERGSLERQWGEGDEISTEDLRVALRRYRSFFERLLSL